MKQFSISILLTMLMSMVGTNVFAYDIEVENNDGVTIYYNYINDGTELEVTIGNYSGAVNIPEEVTFMNRTRKVTSIGEYAFNQCSGLTSVTIPNSVTSIGDDAFMDCRSLTSITIPNSVMSIGEWAFYQCSSLTSITIPNSVTSIGDYVFGGCSGLTSINIPNSVTSIGDGLFGSCSGLTSVTIPNSVTSIGYNAFVGCSSLTSVTIPNSVTSIGEWAFNQCSGLTSVTIPNSVTSIGRSAFCQCSGLSSVTLGNSLTSIENNAFSGFDLSVVISKIENPFVINGKGVFTTNTLNNAKLYVPVGTKEKYKATQGWKDFLFIEEGDGPNGGSGDTPGTKKCATPTIGYQNGKLTFNCDTEGATCQYTITDSDIKSGSSNEVQLGVTYNISVYATKSGYDNSETANATLCWIDVEPKTEGIVNGVASVRAAAVLIQSNGSALTVSGADDGTPINVYSVNGSQAGSAISQNGSASINTSLQPGSIAIVKVGEKSVKVLMK